MKIYIACDHQGVNLKKYLLENIKGYEILSPSIENTPKDDYPDFAFALTNLMDKKKDLGILICGTGIGISIAANKVKGVRAARCVSIEDAKLSKQHNHANVICIPASLSNEDALNIINAFLETPYDNDERHLRRISKIISYEDGAYNEL